jgi:HlyD family secretion protein
VKFNIRWVIITLILLIGIGGVIIYLRMNASKRSEIPAGITTGTIGREIIIGKVGSTGKVRPNQIANLTWQTTGTVGKVFVSDLDRVKKGDKLVELESDSLQATILQAMQAMPAASRDLNALQISDLKRTQAQEDLAIARKNYQNSLDTRKIKEVRNSSDTNLQVAEAAYLTAKSNLDVIERFFSFLQDKPEDDLTRAQATAQLSLARKNYNWALWNYQYAQNKPLPEDVKIAEGNLLVAKSKMDDAQRNWEKVKNTPDPDDITSAKAKVDSLQAQIDLAAISAPFDGTVTSSKLQTGDLVKTGTVAVQLVDLSRMFLDISISEVDINKIQVGQEIQISFDAIPEKLYQGQVTEIASVGEVNQEVIYYKVTCEIKDADHLIKPGMTAAATIAIAKTANVITVPNRSVQTDGVTRFVTVVRGQSLIKIPIELGLIAEDRSEVKSGDLHEGDVVVTNPQSLPTQGPLK